MSVRHYVLTSLALALSMTASADDVTESMFLAEQPMVLTASRIQQSPLDTPAPVTVIDRETIQASGFTEIQDLMRLVPGFQVANWYGGAPYHGSTIVANHGMGSAFPRTLLVMLDGQSVVDPIKGIVDWEDLPVRVQDIERIEVVRGPNQASYGAGAYNGVINIITRQPGEDAGGVVSFSAGRHGFRDDYARFGHRGESTDWRISASDRYLDSFEQTTDSPYLKNGSRQTLMANMVHRLASDQELDANLDLSWGNNNLGSNSDSTDPYHDYSIQTQLLQLAWHSTDAIGTESFARYTHYGHQQNEAYGISVPPSLSIYSDFGADTSQDGLEFQQNRTFSRTLKGVWGVSVQYDQVDAPHYFYGMGVVTDTTWQSFGNLEWRFKPDWLLNVGGMLEKHDNTDVLFSPRLALNYSISPRHSIRASMGEGYRAPTLLESNSNEEFIYNGTQIETGYLSALPVKPEKVKFGELGYVGEFDEIGLHLDGRLYAEHYSQYLNSYSCGTIPCTGITVNDLLHVNLAQLFRNGGDTNVYGEELSADWHQPVLGRFVLSYSIIRIHAEGYPDSADSKPLAADMVLSAPLHSASLLWSKSLPWGLSTSVGYYHVGSMKWLGDGDVQPAYERVDVRLAKRFGKEGSNNEIAFTAQGVNGAHAEFRPGSVPVRQTFVTLKLGF